MLRFLVCSVYHIFLYHRYELRIEIEWERSTQEDRFHMLRIVKIELEEDEKMDTRKATYVMRE